MKLWITNPKISIWFCLLVILSEELTTILPTKIDKNSVRLHYSITTLSNSSLKILDSIFSASP